MRHVPLDHHARHSRFFAVEPTVKFVATVAFVVCVALLVTLEAALFAALFVLALAAASGIPGGHYAKRFAIALPFIVFPAVSALWLRGFESFAVFVLRISACVLVLLVMSSTTPFFDVIRSLRRLGLPAIFTVLLTFLYRYAFIFENELERMLRARRARGYRSGRSILDRRTVDTVSATAGMVLVRAHGRGVRVFDALVARGYDGGMRTLDRWRVDAVSVLYGFTMVTAGLALFMGDRGWLPVIP